MDKQAIDQRVVTHLQAGEVDQAVEVALAAYGPGLFGMMMGVFHDEDTAQETFQHFSIQLWKNIASFKGHSSFYTWAYTVAHRSVIWMMRRPERRREVRLETSNQDAMPERWARTATSEWRKTEAKSRFHELCEELPPEERALVMLRIGQKMAWKDIAEVTYEGEEPLDDDALQKRSASLRKRFERIKTQLARAMKELTSRSS